MDKKRNHSASRRASNKQRFVKIAPNITNTAICTQVEEEGRITLLAPMTPEEIADQGYSPSLPSGDTNIAKIMRRVIYQEPFYDPYKQGELNETIKSCKPVFTSDDGTKVYR